MLDQKNSAFVASRDREIRFVLFLKTSKIVPGKSGYDWPDEYGVKGAYCLNDDSVLTFEYSFADDVVEIAGKKYDSSQGRVFLAESKTKVEQLSATLNPLPPQGVPQRLADDGNGVSRTVTPVRGSLSGSALPPLRRHQRVGLVAVRGAHRLRVPRELRYWAGFG